MQGGIENEIIESADGQIYVLLNHPPLGQDPEGTQIAGPSAYLGKGQFGTVTIAMTRNSAQEGLIPVAAKQVTLDRTSPQFEAQLAELQKECAIMKHLGRQADMIEAPSDNEHEMKLFIMQELLVGVSLKNYLKTLNEQSDALDPNDEVGKMRILNLALSAFIASCEATGELHEKDVIHGDLHNNNILYNPTTHQARVLDFGMSHLLAPGQDTAYVAGVDDMAEIHRAPETLTPRVHREGHEAERVYDKSSDLYALAIDFAIESEMMDHYAPQSAKREVGQFLQLCYDLSRSKYFKDFQREYGITMDFPEVAEKRISRTEALQRLKGIQGQIEAKIAQKTFAPISESILRQVIENRENKRRLSDRAKALPQQQPKRGPAITWARGTEKENAPFLESGERKLAAAAEPKTRTPRQS